MCVCVHVREREGVSVCVYVCVCVHIHHVRTYVPVSRVCGDLALPPTHLPHITNNGPIGIQLLF